MKRLLLFWGLFLLISSVSLQADWDFTDTLDNWKATGWEEFNYTGGGNPDAKLIQNANGTVTIVDPSSTANFYMMRKTEWDVPYTMQLRVKVDFIAGKGAGQNPAISSYVKDKISIQPVLTTNAIADWSINNFFEINTMEFQIYTIVAQKDGSANIYVNNAFNKPAMVVPVGATTFYPETRLEIGSPTGAIATITVDYVALGQGEILEIWSRGANVEKYGKIASLWGSMKQL